jgi:hypothetical protein
MFLSLMLALPMMVAGENLVKEYKQGDLEIDVWVDNEDGIYYEGEDISIYFQADRDCHVIIYSIDTRGEVNLLYPSEPWDDGFVRGGEVYRIPDRVADYNLIVSGPEGIEHIQAVASMTEFDVPDWYDQAPSLSDYYDDREDFVDYLNDRYFNCRWDNCIRAFDYTSIYVKVSRYYYKPVYVPHHWYDYPNYSMVYIDYPYGAEIYIDGIYFGIAPLWIPRVIVGWHWFTIYDRYGYCWENRINVYHNHTVRLDRSRVKTNRTVVSRFKDVRQQSKKYARSSYVLSEEKVKSTRLKKDIDQRGKSRRGTWMKGERGSFTKRSSDAVKKGGQTRKGSRDTRSIHRSDPKKSGSKRSTGSGTVRGPAGTKKSSGSKINQGGSTTKKSGGSKSSGSIKKSGGSKSSGGTKKSGGTVKSGGSKKSGGSVKSGGSKKSGGGSRSSSTSKSTSRKGGSF